MEGALRVNVRTLAEFYYEGGDLESGRGLLKRMLEGARGHRLIQSAYGEDWRSEVAVRMDIMRRGFPLALYGRIDGLKETADRAYIEEIKTTGEDISALTGGEHPVHWAQAELYAVMVAEKDNLGAATVRLVYDDLGGNRVAFTREYDRQALLERLETYLAPFLDWLEAANRWSELSRPTMRAARFPFGGYRAGQRDMAANVYVALRDGRNLLCQAPTGIGKTMAALFPAVKALGEGTIGRIFYLTARSTGAMAADAALCRLRSEGARIRSVCLTAKDTICPMEARDCRPSACPRARGYYDRRRAALYEGLTLERLDRAAIEALAEKHTLCPFELSLDLAENADAVICDYNYVFDPRVKLQRFFTGKSDAGLLIDEAHNLCARARDMLSGRLNQADFRALRRAVGQDGGRKHALYRALTALLNEMKALRAAMGEDTARAERPDELIQAARDFVELADRLGGEAHDWSGELTERLFEALDFLRAADDYGENYRTLIEPHGRDGCDATLWCADPSEHIAETLRRVHGAALFSATLTPLPFYRDLLGLSAETGALLDLPSPFPRENLMVLRYALPLRYREREGSMDALCRSLEAFISAKRGSFLVCFPSYAFMRQVAGRMAGAARLLVQSPGMDEAARRDFLDAAEREPDETTALFVVMGGVFSEGIDLPDNRLSGAAIVGTGVPQLSPPLDALREIYEARYHSGYAYAYQYPGLARVYQAAGRVIRSESDRGAVLLIDARWADRDHRALLPPHWAVRDVRDEADMAAALKAFWTVQEEKKHDLQGD